MSTMRAPTGERARARLAASLLAIPAVLTLVLIAHHPVLRGHPGVAAAAIGVREAAPMLRVVHGGILGLLAVQTMGWQLFSARLGWHRCAAPAGFMAYAAGVLLMVVPLVLDGFVTPDIAAACLTNAQGCGAAAESSFQLVAAMIQDFTKVAAIFVSAGVFCWAVALLMDGRKADRVVGVIGVLCAGIPVAVFLGSDGVLTPGNLPGLIAPYVIWSFAVAGLMVGESGGLAAGGTGRA